AHQAHLHQARGDQPPRRGATRARPRAAARAAIEACRGGPPVTPVDRLGGCRAGQAGVRVKPLTVSHTPSESSQIAIGSAQSAPTAEVWSQPPKIVAVADTRMIGAPTRPMVGMIRGTSRPR